MQATKLGCGCLHKIEQQQKRTANSLSSLFEVGLLCLVFHCFAAVINTHSHTVEPLFSFTRIATERHTYFTQRLCHTVYDMAHGKVDVALVKQAAEQILQSDSVVFGQYQQLLTTGQWNFLIAIAKEGEASQITSRQFLRKYNLGNPSSVSRIVPSLVEKNLLDENLKTWRKIGLCGSSYQTQPITPLIGLRPWDYDIIANHNLSMCQYTICPSLGERNPNKK